MGRSSSRSVVTLSAVAAGSVLLIVLVATFHNGRTTVASPARNLDGRAPSDVVDFASATSVSAVKIVVSGAATGTQNTQVLEANADDPTAAGSKFSYPSVHAMDPVRAP